MSRVVCDVVLIGAGVLGCSTAFHLSPRRGIRVIVVEKGALASGMTKRSGALVHTPFAHKTETQLARASLRAFQNWKELVGGSCGFTQTGCVTIAGNVSDAAMLREPSDRASEIISPAELSKLQPGVRTDDVTLATYEPAAGYADPVATAQTLAARAKENGVVFKTGTLVKSICVELGRVTGVDTTTGRIDTLKVVVMAGAWTDRLLKPLGVAIGIQNLRAQVAFFERPADLKAGHPAFIDWTTGAHFRPHTFGLTMAGLNAPQAEENPDHFDETIPPGFVADLQARLAARLPALANARYLRGHAGVYDVTRDARPVVSHIPGIEGLMVAAGFGGAGFALAPAVGACVAEMVADGEARTVDLKELDMARLGTSVKREA